jgi:hypothetical protein
MPSIHLVVFPHVMIPSGQYLVLWDGPTGHGRIAIMAAERVALNDRRNTTAAAVWHPVPRVASSPARDGSHSRNYRKLQRPKAKWLLFSRYFIIDQSQRAVFGTASIAMWSSRKLIQLLAVALAAAL